MIIAPEWDCDFSFLQLWFIGGDGEERVECFRWREGLGEEGK
jgi:hypothetical protein